MITSITAAMACPSHHGRPTRRRAPGAACRGLVVVSVLLSSCGSGAEMECMAAGAAEVCLSKGSKREVTATGLEPNSQVIALETPKEGAPAGTALPPINATSDGTFPPDGASFSFVGGSGPLIIVVTVTPRGGKLTTVTFRRS